MDLKTLIGPNASREFLDALDDSTERSGKAIQRSVRKPSADRATSEPGGCECMECGRIFIGAPWHTVCGLCVEPNHSF